MFKNLSVDPRIRSVIEEPIPRELIKERKGGGGSTLSYVSGAYVIDQLNRAFNYAWSWKIDKLWIQESTGTRKKVWKDGQPTDEYQEVKPGPVAHVMGTLTVTLMDKSGERFEISKTATGSKSIIGNQAEQESIFKSAGTDALKKAASLFGIGAPLYRAIEEQNYFNSKVVQSYWTEEEEEKHRAETEYLESLGVSVADLDGVVVAWSNGKYRNVSDLMPDVYSEFVTFVKNQQEAQATK